MNYLESQIDKIIDKVNAMGYHGHKNNPNRTIDGIFLSGEPYDYDLFLPNYKACFDAKMCDAEKWHMQKKDIKQSNYLKKCKNSGMDSFFLVYFTKKKKLVMFDVDIVIEKLKTTKSIEIEVGCEWPIMHILDALSVTEHSTKGRSKPAPIQK